jgi:hypothetical protein
MPTGLAIKALCGTNSPVHSETEWTLPTENADGTFTPGAWVRCRPGKVEYRKNGIHVAGCDQIAWWTTHLRGKKMTAYICEYRGQVSIGPHGFAAREVRLLRPWDGREEV